MDIAVIKIRSSSSVRLFRDKDISGEQLAVAPAALAASAPRGYNKTGAFTCDHKRFVGRRGNVIFFSALYDMEIEGPPADLLGISRLVPGIFDRSEQLTADKLLP